MKNAKVQHNDILHQITQCWMMFSTHTLPSIFYLHIFFRLHRLSPWPSLYIPPSSWALQSARPTHNACANTNYARISVQNIENISCGHRYQIISQKRCRNGSTSMAKPTEFEISRVISLIWVIDIFSSVMVCILFADIEWNSTRCGWKSACLIVIICEIVGNTALILYLHVYGRIYDIYAVVVLTFNMFC